MYTFLHVHILDNCAILQLFHLSKISDKTLQKSLSWITFYLSYYYILIIMRKLYGWISCREIASMICQLSTNISLEGKGVDYKFLEKSSSQSLNRMKSFCPTDSSKPQIFTFSQTFGNCLSLPTAVSVCLTCPNVTINNSSVRYSLISSVGYF